MRRSWVLLAAVPIVALALVIPPALADDGLVRTTWPSAEDPGVPFYARIEGTDVVNDGEWAAIVFYRDPGCQQLQGFNLLDFFDAPAAFGCPLTVEGFSLWLGEAFVGAPKIATLKGTGAVPMWFVPLSSFQAATQDGVLTIGELADLEGLIVGTASRFNETLHPHPLPPELGGGGHEIPKLIVRSHGQLEDGRSFSVLFTEVNDETRAVKIAFR